MASPYDSVYDMFDIPRYEGFAGGTVFPRRETPQDMSRRSFLEGAVAQTPEDQEWEMAMQSPDPMGVMQELKRVREERDTEDLIASIAELDPASKDYLSQIRGTMAQNPKGFMNPAVGRILEFQNRMMPAKRPAPTFQYPQFQSQYQKLIAGGTDPQAAADEVQMAEQQYGLQRQLAASGLAFDSPEMMTDGRLDELKVLQSLARAKADSRLKAPQFRIPTDLSEELQSAILSQDPAAIEEARNAINSYQQTYQEMWQRATPQAPVAKAPTVPTAPTEVPVTPVPQAAAQPAPVPPVQPTGPNLVKHPTEQEMRAQALTVAPQKLSVDAQAALQKLGPDKLLEYYMAKTPENPTNPGDVRDANAEKKSLQKDLLKEWGVDETRLGALDEAANILNELMGPYGYQTRMEMDKQPRFVNAAGTTAPVIKSIRLKTS